MVLAESICRKSSPPGSVGPGSSQCDARADAHDGLSLLAQRDGVPSRIIMDGSKEQTMGLFRWKAKEMGVHIKQTEPHSPWQNAAELAIRELKKGAGP